MLTLCNREDSGQRLDDSLQHDPALVDRGHDLAGGPEVEGLQHSDEVHHDAAQVDNSNFLIETTLISLSSSS